MSRRAVLPIASGILLLLAGGQRLAPSIEAEIVPAAVEGNQPGELCLYDPTSWESQTGPVAARQQAARAPARQEVGSVSADWPGREVLGGDIPPVRAVADPYPTFDGIALDPENNRVVMSDENRHSLLAYDRTSGSQSDEITQPLRHIIGPETLLGFSAGVAVDPGRREMYTVNNDGGDKMVVFSYDDQGNSKPRRILNVPHQAWGVSLNRTRDELAVTVQQLHGIVVYHREAKASEAPLRIIRGGKTGLADPHGVYFDGINNELVVANHGNWTELKRYTAYDPLTSGSGTYVPGRFQPPSITVHAAAASGDAPPLRTIQGPRTQLNWPMGLDVDTARNEMAVANYGDSSVLIFRRTDSGDAAPVRVIRGNRTSIVGLVGVAIDTKHDELWVANYGDHTALVFDRAASGNVEPKRIIRNAPAATPTCGFTNASAAAYDTKRGEILVPN